MKIAQMYRPVLVATHTINSAPPEPKSALRGLMQRLGLAFSRLRSSSVPPVLRMLARLKTKQPFAGLAARRDFCSTLDRMLSSSNRFSPLQGDYRK